MPSNYQPGRGAPYLARAKEVSRGASDHAGGGYPPATGARTALGAMTGHLPSMAEPAKPANQ